MPPQPKNVPVDEAKTAYESGATLAELGQKYDCSASTVRNVLLNNGVTMRPRGGKKKAPAAV